MKEILLIDFQIILRSYFITLAWAVIAWPVVSRTFRNLPDKGWAIGRLLLTMTISLVVWNLGHLGLKINSDVGVMGVSAVLAIFSIIIFKKREKMSRKTLFNTLKYVLIEEYLFVFGFAIMAIIRGFSPEIRTLEKFMDYGFVIRYLESATLPAEDMWMATKQINYYSFGHFWASIVIRFFSVEPAYGYNLVLALITGLTMSISFAVTSTLTAVRDIARIVGGFVTSFAIAFGGNSHTVWYFLNHLGLTGYWYADATRFIYNTIHEFPSYSFVVSDLHGHLLDLPVILTFLVIMIAWTKKKMVIFETLMGGLVGIMAMTNTWDVAVYGLVMGVYCLISLVTRKFHFLIVFRSLAVILGMALLVSGTWWVGFESISDGIGWVQQRSPLWQMAVLWTGGLIAGILALVSRNKKRAGVILAIVISILSLLAIPEFIFARDIYPSHPRANTMFKLTYQAFVLMGVCLGVAAGQAMGGWRKRVVFRTIIGITAGVIFASSMIFPMVSFPSYYGDFKTYRGLNGENWLRQTSNGYYEAILFLRDNNEGRNIVEAVGDSYTEYNSVSAFSGVPTILGWRVHEWLWRGGYELVGKRDEEVKIIYEGKEIDKISELLGKYRVGWIVVGPNERKKYTLNEKGLLGLGLKVFEKNDVYLIKVR